MTGGFDLADDRTRRLLVVADTDSYVKWGAALASTLPEAWSSRVVVLTSPVQPSSRQLADALAGTRFTPDGVRFVHVDDLGAIVDEFDPHAVLLSLRGPFVRVVAPQLEGRANRPVLVSGFPGLTIPAVPKAIVYREQTDLIVLHSRREVREFRANAAELEVSRTFGLATLPFLPDAAPEGSAGASVSSTTGGTDVVFAAQAKVPAERDDRVRILEALAAHARLHPDRRVVVKVRARRGEAQTHAEEFDYADLLDELDDVPSNLVVEDGPMAEKLARAGALVTVSSTAALEAVAHDMPALLIDDFGISAGLINTVFEGSGLFGSTSDLVEGRFRRADAGWLHDNYFHGDGADDWARRLDAFVAAREIVPLPRLERRHNLTGGRLRWAFERRRMLGSYDRSTMGLLAWGVGVPARALLRRVRWVRRQLRGGPPDAAATESGFVASRVVEAQVSAAEAPVSAGSAIGRTDSDDRGRAESTEVGVGAPRA